MAKLDRDSAHDLVRLVLMLRAHTNTSIQSDGFSLSLVPVKEDPDGFDQSSAAWVNFANAVIEHAKELHSETFSGVALNDQTIKGYHEKQLAEFVSEVLNEAGV